MKDSYGRKIEYLRLSVTDLCDFRCLYCMPESGVIKLEHRQILSLEQMLNVAKAAKRIGITKLRLTGGEPLVKKHFLTLVEEISKLKFECLCITTNGASLNQYAQTLKNLGVDRVNISIDSVNRETFNKISRRDKLEDVLSGIDSAINCGFEIKLNAVLLKGINDSEINELIDFAKRKKLPIRFIELMPTEYCQNFSKEHYISSEDVISKTNAEYIRDDGVSKIYQIDGYEVGFISPISNKFCSSCNKIRVTSNGDYIACLHSNIRHSLLDYVDDVDSLANKLQELILKKPLEHNIEKEDYLNLTMNQIGG